MGTAPLRPPSSLAPRCLPTCHKQQVGAVLGEVARRSDRQTGDPPLHPPHMHLLLCCSQGSCRALLDPTAVAPTRVWVMWPRTAQQRAQPGLRRVSGGSSEEMLSLSQTCLSGSSPPRLYSPSQVTQSGSPQFCPQGDPWCSG